ncbi:ABC transporter permease [Bremerella sp. P1]|uniref:ABC transporter permease n=1 Tax=Bremerella sp. P1 TaxID=3026424 RepID=UPI0023679A51|nr:ABC transporter permease [Bremerella sp. P1]WDI39929.1 ABC transporter permease [Bremerella sp. P1]
MWFRPLAWDYAIRNLFRRPLRTLLTLGALTVVILLVFIVVGFIRGLERNLQVSGDSDTVLIFSLGMGENLEYSSIPMRSSDLIAASIPGIRERQGKKYVSPELYLGTEVATDSMAQPAMGLVRGVTPEVLLVRNRIQLEKGHWPGPGEVLVGRMAAVKLGLEQDAIVPGDEVQFEGRPWKVAGTFSATGGAFESEVWCRLDELQQSMKRQDLSLVALRLSSSGDFSDVDLFCKERLDLELQAARETEYYAGLQRDYGPIRWLAWLVVLLISGAGILAGLNTMYGAVVGRISELAMLQTLGFVRRAILLSLIQEGLLLAASASLLATLIALTVFNGASVRFTMGAFALRIDNVCILVGCGVGFLLGFLGSLPPAYRALRMPVVDGLKSV